jgi:decaprenylphospho-beta-D-ribofuranose 2-oxidase
VSRAGTVAVRTVDEVRSAIAQAGPRGLVVRGRGCSCGDAARSGGATVLDLSALSSIDLDTTSATVTTGSGVTLDALLKALVPAGYFLPVTAGSGMATVGGSVATDVHGTNHRGDGSFGSHLSRMTVVDGTGELVTLGPDAGPERFWATVGGLGRTGVIVEATFDLILISSAFLSVDTERASDLEVVMDRMIAREDDYRYSVAWIDSVHPPGRGVLARSNHAPADWLAGRRAQQPLAFSPRTIIAVPGLVPNGVVSPLSTRAVNEALFHWASKRGRGELRHVTAFFHPLDAIRDWQRLFGPAGLLQYQFTVPDAAAHLVRRALTALRRIGAVSPLTVLMRLGPANPAPLSFPRPGWSLTVGLPAGIEGLAATLDALDEQILGAGGRLNLASDARMSRETVASSYPRLSEWQRVCRAMDPDGVFTSDQWRRLRL